MKNIIPILIIIIIVAITLTYFVTPRIERLKNQVNINYKGYSIGTEGIEGKIKVKIVTEYVERVGAECTFLKIVN